MWFEIRCFHILVSPPQIWLQKYLHILPVSVSVFRVFPSFLWFNLVSSPCFLNMLLNLPLILLLLYLIPVILLLMACLGTPLIQSVKEEHCLISLVSFYNFVFPLRHYLCLFYIRCFLKMRQCFPWFPLNVTVG